MKICVNAQREELRKLEEAKVWAKQGATMEQLTEEFGRERAEIGLASQGKFRID